MTPSVSGPVIFNISMLGALSVRPVTVRSPSLPVTAQVLESFSLPSVLLPLKRQAVVDVVTTPVEATAMSHHCDTRPSDKATDQLPLRAEVTQVALAAVALASSSNPAIDMNFMMSPQKTLTMASFYKTPSPSTPATACGSVVRRA